MGDGTVFRCASCGAPLLPATRGFVRCRYCHVDNRFAIPTIAEEVAALGADARLISFAPTPLLHELPRWLFDTDELPEATLWVLPTTGAWHTTPAAASAAAGLPHFLAERLILEAGVAASSTVLVNDATKSMTSCRTAPTYAAWRKVISGPALVWVETCGSDTGHAKIRMATSAGDVTTATTRIEALLPTVLDWATANGLGHRRDLPRWYGPASASDLPQHLLVHLLQCELLVANGLTGTSSRATDTFRAMKERYGPADVRVLVDMLLELVEDGVGRSPQLALALSAAMTTADDGDFLDDARRGRIGRLASGARPGTLLHDLSPWILDFVGDDERSRARMHALRPLARRSYAEWLDGIAMEDPCDPHVMATIANLRASDGPRSIRLLSGVGELEFGAPLREVERVLGPGVANRDGYTFAGGTIDGLFEDDRLWLLEVRDPSYLFHGDDLWAFDTEQVLAYCRARGLPTTVDAEKDGFVEITAPSVEVGFVFHEGKLFAIHWSS